MTQAVERRLVSDVPIGAFLSGGIDSTIVVGLMSRAMPEPVRTFSIGFEGDVAYDETAYARLAAKRFGTQILSSLSSRLPLVSSTNSSGTMMVHSVTHLRYQPTSYRD